MLDYHPGKVAIPNLDNLCQPVLPEDIQWDGGIGWSGSHGYSFHTEQNTFQRFSYSVITQEAYDQQKDRLSNYTGTENEEVIRVEHIEDRNATIYYTRTKNGHESSFMYYEIQVGDREIFVEEHRNYYYGNLNSYMHIYIGENGHYGCIYLEPEEARPSVEYLSSFGLAAYEIEK